MYMAIIPCCIAMPVYTPAAPAWLDRTVPTHDIPLVDAFAIAVSVAVVINLAQPIIPVDQCADRRLSSKLDVRAKIDATSLDT
jgi:hypothetical protein